MNQRSHDLVERWWLEVTGKGDKTRLEEVRNPRRELPIGIIGSLAVCTVLYVVVAAIMTGIVPFARFAGVDHPVSLALQYAGQNWVAGSVDQNFPVQGRLLWLLKLIIASVRVYRHKGNP